MNGNSLLKEIGRSYIVSSFIPASLFVYLLVFLFRDFIPQSVIDRFQGNFIFNGSVVFLGFFTFWVAFALYSNQDPITKFYEGYHFPRFIRFPLTKIQAVRHWFLTKRIKKARELSENSNDISKILEFQKIYPDAMSDFQPLELETPIEAELLLPTRLGNVLRASEIYPYNRYGIDGITIWPRLYNFLPIEIKADLEKINNQFAFLLNSSFLILILVIACLAVATTQFLCVKKSVGMPICTSTVWIEGFRQFTYVFYYYCSLLGAFLCYFIYRRAVDAAVTHGLYVRTAYDLYRDRLLDYLNKSLTEKLEDKKQTWEKIGDFYIAGQYFKPVKFGNTKTQPKLRCNPGLVLAGGIAAGLVYRIARSQKCR